MKKQLLYGVAMVLATLFVAAGIYAAMAPEVIEMNNPGFTKHTKGIVVFNHGKHVKDGVSCGECHHDDAGKPLTALKDGDPVQKCSECHSAFELDKADKKMKKEEKIKKYYKEALHANCIDCHKKEKKGPTKCADCHPKKK